MMTERDLSRRARHRLAVLRHVEEVSGSVAATCRYYGISRQCYCIWLRRYEAEGLEGLKDRSSAPHHTPHATQADVVEKILWLRQQYHFGPSKIAMHLERYHDVKVSSSGVWRILKKVGLNRLPASQRPPTPISGPTRKVQRYHRARNRWRLRRPTAGRSARGTESARSAPTARQTTAHLGQRSDDPNETA